MKKKMCAFALVCNFFFVIAFVTNVTANDKQEVGLREQGWTSFTAGKYTYAAQGLEGELVLTSKRVNKYSLKVKTYRTDNQNGCGFSGECTENADDLVCVNADKPEIKVILQAEDGAVNVDGENITYFCGHRVTFQGKYILKEKY